MSPRASDALMAAKQAFSLVSGAFGGAGGRDVPGLDVELDAVEVGDRPREAGQRDECRRSNAPPSGAGSNEVAGRRPALGQLGEPEADLSDGQVGVRFGDRKDSPRRWARRSPRWRSIHAR